MTTPPPPLNYATPSRRGMPVWAWVLIGLAAAMALMGCLVLAGAVFWMGSSSAPTPPVTHSLAIPSTSPAVPTPTTEPP